MLSTNEKYKAIVIGTSAGGLSALTVILEKIPVDCPLSVIVVQHRSKDQKDLLEEVLQSKCKIRIKQADEKEKIEPGVVYIAPPDYHLLVESAKTFSLSSDEPVHFSRPSIDVLFETAAMVFKDTLIGIILTGSNNDGSAGVIAVNKYGGLTISQKPGDSQFPFMPEAAIKTNKIKHIWTLSEIQNFLSKITNTSNEKKQ